MMAELTKFLQENFTSILISGILILFGVYQWLKRPPNFPPGPVGLPVLGVAHKLTKRAEIELMKLSQHYGPVMGVKLLRNFTVILSDYQSIHEAFVKQGPVFSGRPKAGIFHIFTEGKGVLAIDGPRWKENRKFGTVIFRKLGSGKKLMEDRIVDEMTSMCAALQLIKGKAFDISSLVTHASANVLCSFAFSRRFDYSDVKFISVARTLVDWFSDNADAFLLMIMAQFLVYFPVFSKMADSLRKATQKLYTLLLPFIEDHKENLDAYEYRDYVDAYLLEIEKHKEEPNTFYTEDELKGHVRDLFVAGTDTTSTTLKWCLILLINRKEVQKKIQKEIDRVIGPDARPKMAHMEDMHYLKAYVHEVFRYRTPGPLGLVHRTLKDTKLFGYNIPKNTQVMANFWALHHDPKLWEKPEEFHPERFFDADGKFQKPTHVIPFSIGSRYCMGESIARMEIYFFLICILQRFHLNLESEDASPISEECAKSGQFLIAPRFKMQVEERFCKAKSIKEYQDSMWQ